MPVACTAVCRIYININHLGTFYLLGKSCWYFHISKYRVPYGTGSVLELDNVFFWQPSCPSTFFLLFQVFRDFQDLFRSWKNWKKALDRVRTIQSKSPAMLFASSDNKPIKVKYLHPNKVGHAMIHNFKGLKQAPQSPLMSCQEKQKRRSRNTCRKKSPRHKPVTTKITSTPPLTDFYWGKHITKATPLTPRMKSLQRGK